MMRNALVVVIVGSGVWFSNFAGIAWGAGENLRVLDTDISREELNDTMVGFLRGLGLPRLGGEGCLYCHVGDMDVPRREWDFASDAKPMKKKTRAMMVMTDEINNKHLSGLDSRIDDSFEVSCMTCHLGRTDPRPLAEVLLDTYEKEGIEATAEQFRILRERYEGTPAYDFRAGTLNRIASTLVGDGKMDDAIALARVNVEMLPDDASAWRGLLFFEMEQKVDTEGVEAALTLLDARAPDAAPGSAGNGLIDSLAWTLIRSDREAQGYELIEANFERYPGEYRPLESKAFMLNSTGRLEEAVALLEGWIEEHPDHSRAKNLLVNMKSGLE